VEAADPPAKMPGTIKLYPNPAKDFVSIQVPTDLIGSRISILDISGRIIHDRRISGEISTINVSGFRPGLYFVGVNNKSPCLKLIVY